MVVLCKANCPDYSSPKAYRPIVLYNTIGKVISGVITDVTVYLTIRHNLLPPQHFGSLPRKMTTDLLLHTLGRTEQIGLESVWGLKQVIP